MSPNVQKAIEQLTPFCPPESLPAIAEQLELKEQELERPIYDKFRLALKNIQALDLKPKGFSIKDGVVQIGNARSETQLHEAAETMMPWRKGPFQWHGIDLDAEWNSSIKWQRMEKAVGPLWGKRILDIGCNNGYYMMRAAEQDPSFLLGIDPTIRFYYQWQLLTTGLPLNQTAFHLLGIQDLPLLKKSFDVILCLGILYHHSDPIGQLKDIVASLRKGGKAIIEVQGIDHPEAMCLFPEKRYAKAPGVWFLPSLSCLKHWMLRAGFKSIDVIDSSKTTLEEQRNTPWCPRPFETLQDFLDPDDEEKTVEGYPAPWRHMILGRL